MKRVVCSDAPAENYLPNLQLSSSFQLIVSLSVTSCLGFRSHGGSEDLQWVRKSIVHYDIVGSSH